ncbi:MULTISPECIES: DoxX family protein [Chryseobacterium]|jgi:putative oxidoreductase|uniref:DoxX n=1 Tax=Chryseobacterium balustinum TaxID=246 RepID=A0AAX2IN79_9FLAO|nr:MULTISPECIES: DoxX family protein [Chryseobacterium]AZB29255.1 DoxX family protein [Chryseobacterium balustinum]MDY0931181.1 DoxX family protein [Chryseobacterium sp. CFBP8996]SKB70232.1 putative oxidoreductase [Chryseobacterium balustinum]SQA91474.1 DoxX [Chryseobacterium balustinum]
MSYSNTKANPIIFDIVLFLVRLFIGFAMISHGFPKLQTLIDGGEIKFYDFLGLGPKISLGLTVFAEFVCSIFLILGLFTRVAAGFLIFTMAIAAFVVHGADAFDKRELSLLYLSIYLIIISFGAGRFSIDGMIEKRRRANDW